MNATSLKGRIILMITVVLLLAGASYSPAKSVDKYDLSPGKRSTFRRCAYG